MAYGILVPRPGIELTPPAVEAQRLNHWPTSEYPISHDIFIKFILSRNIHLLSDLNHASAKRRPESWQSTASGKDRENDCRKLCGTFKAHHGSR